VNPIQCFEGDGVDHSTRVRLFLYRIKVSRPYNHNAGSLDLGYDPCITNEWSERMDRDNLIAELRVLDLDEEQAVNLVQMTIDLEMRRLEAKNPMGCPTKHTHRNRIIEVLAVYQGEWHR
jgi:hypothetical protein